MENKYQGPVFKATLPIMQAAQRYHQHEVVGMQHVPQQGHALLVVNHSLATYDILLLIVAIYNETRRLPRALVDRLFFKIPMLGEIALTYGGVKGSPDAASDLLAAGEIVTVAPGGMREALRPSSERYQIQWQGRLGFVRLAMRTRAPIILAACPKADDVFKVYPSHMTSWFYQAFKIPIFFARGLGPTIVPRPAKLVHYLSEPMVPPEWSDEPSVVDERASAFHARLVARMQGLMQKSA